jgi:hypothetical protein
MSASKFTPENRGSLIERTASGVSLADSCIGQVGVLGSVMTALRLLDGATKVAFQSANIASPGRLAQ